ncbi:MAG TPA: quinone-dependent dihydroorotate dehydrogenase [Burkholderiales bacterium]|jgi:dihydroorotate dehydrogenase|nr:quinone-dependent dihydroorotate dehydrogenase [Burkholderiales bacterium]
MLYRLARPLLFALDAERAHRLVLQGLEAAHAARVASLLAGRVVSSPRSVMGLQFPNPVGLAAGLDKNAEHVDALSALGFGFIEVGTVTPRPQPGNPPPRLFRIPAARALINRMGFNNLGVERLVLNLRRARYRGVLGVNIGKNFDTPLERAVDDYLYCLRRVHPVATYVAVNISSPNTRDLRDLQQAAQLDRLLPALTAERDRLAEHTGRRVPLVVKVAPDLEDAQIDAIAKLLVVHGIDGAIATNTTVDHSGVAGLRHGAEAGGLSGAPLKPRADAVLRRLVGALGGRVPVIGVGGILTGADARAKLDAGAALVQLYTGLVYRGPRLIAEVARSCAQAQHHKE